MNKIRQVIRIFVPVIILVGAVIFAKHLNETAPKVKKKARVRPVPLVKVEPLKIKSTRVEVKLLGRVETVRSLTIQPRVSGELIYVNDAIRMGSRFAKGDLLYRIDPRDYELELEQVKAALMQLEADLVIEQGRARLAKRELELSGLAKKISEEELELTLRKPQMKILAAKINLEKSKIKQAKLKIERCEVRAPFAMMISEQEAELGQQVGQNSVLARAKGTDKFRVSLKVPSRDLNLLPENMRDVKAKIKLSKSSSSEHFWLGDFERFLPGVEAKGMMTQLLYLVSHPLEFSVSKRLLAGSFVEATLVGEELQGGYDITSKNLHEGDTLYLFKDGVLQILSVNVLWRGKERVYVTSAGLEEGDLLVVTPITGPVNAMKLSVVGAEK